MCGPCRAHGLPQRNVSHGPVSERCGGASGILALRLWAHTTPLGPPPWVNPAAARTTVMYSGSDQTLHVQGLLDTECGGTYPL